MLVLSRHPNEGVVVGDGGRVVVVRVVGSKVWLGFVFPAEVPIHRDEVAAAIKREEGVSDDKT